MFDSVHIEIREFRGRLLGVDPKARDARLVIGTVLGSFGMTLGALQGSGRYKKISMPRHLIMYLLRLYTRMSFPQIGRPLGSRDHSTVISGCRKIMAFRHDSEESRALSEICLLLERAGLVPDLGRLPPRKKVKGIPVYR